MYIYVHMYIYACTCIRVAAVPSIQWWCVCSRTRRIHKILVVISHRVTSSMQGAAP